MLIRDHFLNNLFSKQSGFPTLDPQALGPEGGEYRCHRSSDMVREDIH